mgnify:CR=1 FL=1
MFDNLVFFLGGLIIGWNVLPQPQWVKLIYDFFLARLKGFLFKTKE